uniref:Putative calcineurin-like phosphoesterase n=2 Tax=viral metagenome TaxID=1070528 RepID=A0A6M3JP55_9ZZZZ
MKLLLTGDWQLRFRKPEMRLDENYFETQAGKVRQILEIAEKNDCGAILQPGDFFDGVETPWFVVQHYMKMLIDILFDKGIDLICSPGQHDLRYHTREIENTPLGVLKAAQILSLEEIISYGDGIQICSVWWGNNEIPRTVKSKNNILLMHRMVLQKKLWLGQTDFVYARDLLKNYPEFDLFVTGDNHQGFVEEDNGRYVVNCGSLMRANIDQVDHKPRVYVYDTEKRSLEEIFLKVAPVKKVLDIKKAEVQKERDERLELFIANLKQGERGTTFDFIDRLYEVMNDKKVDQETKGIIEEALGK